MVQSDSFVLVLYENPGDELAVRCTLTAYINMSRFEDAIEYARKNPTVAEWGG